MEEVAVAPQSQLGAEAVELLGSLIRLETVNPPGNERPAQELLAELLREAGFECELLAAEPERPNLIARLPGEGPGPTLCVLGHVDTVPAQPGEWSFDPWSGDVVDEEVRGRGAQDMKGQVAAEVAACAGLARSGWRPERGELQVVITADEEMGAGLGARWLCEEHPERVRCDLVVNEGGGQVVEFEGQRLYTLCVGEKGVFRFWLRARGEAGHASLPRVGDNALLKLAPLLTRLAEQPPPEPSAPVSPMLEALLGDEASQYSAAGELTAGIERVRDSNPTLAAFIVEPMLGVTLVPTKADASHKDNVIPSLAEALIDCRVPPGMGEDDVRERVGRVLGEGDWELEFAERVVGNASSFETPLAEAIAAWVAEADPGAGVLPIVLPGFSDSHWFRKAFDCTAYGFCPQAGMSLEEMVPLIHGADERIKAADVELAARFFEDLVVRTLGGGE